MLLEKIKKLYAKLGKKYIFLTISVGFIVITLVVILNLLKNDKPKEEIKPVEQCMVYFDARGGIYTESLKINCGDKLKLDSTPSKEGFIFTGWYYNNELFDFENKINENIILTAEYTQKDDVTLVKVKFDSNGGSKVENIEIAKGGVISAPLEPFLPGYKFVGWYLNNKKFKFDTTINKSITLKAKWEQVETQSNKNNVIIDNYGNENILIGGGEYKCSGSYINKSEERTFYLESDNLNWSSGFNYYSDGCKFIYKSSNEGVAKISDSKKFTLYKEGSATISECLIDEKTNKELGCYKWKLNVKNLSCKYQTDSVFKNNYVHEYTVNKEIKWPISYFMSYDEGCKLVYKTDNSSLIEINKDGTIKPKMAGNTNIHQCISEKTSGNILECFTINAQVKESRDEQIKKSQQLVDAIAGNYWYLEGYKYAYLNPRKEENHLVWYSEFLELNNNKFITSEDTLEYYSSSVNINNKFVSGLDYAYKLIDEYNMKVKDNKLYITLYGKTYTFIRKNSKLEIKASINISESEITKNEGESFDILGSVSIENFGYYSLSPDLGYDNSIISCNSFYPGTEKDFKITCHALKEGNTTITVKDTHGGDKKVIKVYINDVPKKVIGIKLDKNSVNIKPNESVKLTATLVSYFQNPDNDKIIWSTDNPEVATVDENGLVKTYKEGGAVITAKSDDGGYMATCTVNSKYERAVIRGSYTFENTNINASIKILEGSGDFTVEYLKMNVANAVHNYEIASSTNSYSITYNGGKDYSNWWLHLFYKVRDNITNIVYEDEIILSTKL